MYTFIFFFAGLVIVHSKVTSDDMLLYWKKLDTQECKPFTYYKIGCNRCVCGADGIEYCTRMRCFTRKGKKKIDYTPPIIINARKNFDKSVESESVSSQYNQ